jgi:hypothetical protein
MKSTCLVLTALLGVSMPVVTSAQQPVESHLADPEAGIACPLSRVAMVRGSDSEAREGGGFEAARGHGIHGAVDLNGSLGEPVFAVAAGKVVVAARSDWGGRHRSPGGRTHHLRAPAHGRGELEPAVASRPPPSPPSTTRNSPTSIQSRPTAVVHFPFRPRGSTVSGRHSKLWYPRLYLVLLWSNPTLEPVSVAPTPLPVNV